MHNHQVLIFTALLIFVFGLFSRVSDETDLSARLLELRREAPTLVLTLPKPVGDGDMLSFPERAVPRVGMTKQLAKIRDFLNHSEGFSWWILTGEAGAGVGFYATMGSILARPSLAALTSGR